MGKGGNCGYSRRFHRADERNGHDVASDPSTDYEHGIHDKVGLDHKVCKNACQDHQISSVSPGLPIKFTNDQVDTPHSNDNFGKLSGG